MAEQGKILEVLFEKAIETHEKEIEMLDLVDRFEPGQSTMQNADNFIWRTVQQHAPIIDGFDLTGQATNIIQETYPAILGTPKNDIFEQRVDQLRDMTFWEKRGEESGRKQASELNRRVAALVSETGSLFLRSDTTSGYNFIAQAQAIMNERQLAKGEMTCFSLNDRAQLKFSEDLAGRQTLQGRPAETWTKGQIGQNIAGFEKIQTASYLANLTGGATPAADTVAVTVSDKPEGGNVTGTGTVSNVDYRVSTIEFTDASGYAVGDRLSFTNGAVPVNAIALMDKTNTNQAMTVCIVSITGNTVEVFPKIIAQDDGALSTLEVAYANVDTQIISGTTIVRLNVDPSAKTNIFWAKNSIEVLGGDAPVELLSQYGGKKVISSTMSNGQKMYMAYDGDIFTMNFTCRLFTWYGLTNKNPSANGVAISY